VSIDPVYVHRDSQRLLADPARVIAKLFLPGQELLASGISRADAVVQRLLLLSEDEVSATLAATVADFEDRHRDLPAILRKNFALVAHRLPNAAELSDQRRALIGAYFTQEYSVESAALLNPSMVAHPDQTGLAPGDLRFIMSARAVGEGHISSIEFRTGVFSPPATIHVDDPGPYLATADSVPAPISREFVRDSLAHRPDASLADHLLSLLPAQFSADDLELALASVARDQLTRSSTTAIIERIRWIAACNYVLRFPPDLPLAGTVIVPTAPDECQGVEDARFTRFIDDDGSVTYYATYTAFDGSQVAPHLVQTDDFRTFDISQLIGKASRNKGMALFPRRIAGRFFALSRWDRESIDITSSDDLHRWHQAVTVQAPEQPWELIQLGNCGPPLETPQGWLVLTHGVGPMRRYGIGAILLDLDDPTILLGALTEPLLTPTGAERNGYVPNVVYSCGGLIHGEVLLIPYGCSDSSIKFATVELPALMAALLRT
jgi:predicted GH43/DUF377 family glycosyl hydrolase